MFRRKGTSANGHTRLNDEEYTPILVWLAWKRASSNVDRFWLIIYYKFINNLI